MYMLYIVSPNHIFTSKTNPNTNCLSIWFFQRIFYCLTLYKQFAQLNKCSYCIYFPLYNIIKCNYILILSNWPQKHAFLFILAASNWTQLLRIPWFSYIIRNLQSNLPNITEPSNPILLFHLSSSSIAI